VWRQLIINKTTKQQQNYTVMSLSFSQSAAADLSEIPQTTNVLCPIRTGAYNFPCDWRPRCYKIADTNMSAYQQRTNMIENAESIIKQNFVESLHGMVCKPVKEVVTVPEAHIEQCNTKSCHVVHASFTDGVGTGRNYMLLQ
jgi:hypothetical protein